MKLLFVIAVFIGFPSIVLSFTKDDLRDALYNTRKICIDFSRLGDTTCEPICILRQFGILNGTAYQAQRAAELIPTDAHQGATAEVEGKCAQIELTKELCGYAKNVLGCFKSAALT